MGLANTCYYIVCVFVAKTSSAPEELQPLRVASAETRPIRPNDIGIYFVTDHIDLTIENTYQTGHPNETLFVDVKSDECCMQFSGKPYPDCELPPLIGGYLEALPPGRESDVTLIYPMNTLFDRLGHCDLEIRSNRSNGDSIHLFHRIFFNTSENLDHFHTGHASLVGNCSTEDLNRFDNCAPVNCEDKYFGKRNFFNGARNACEVAVRCALPETFDNIGNECVDRRKLASELETMKMRAGEFDQNVWPSPAAEKQKFCGYEDPVDVPRPEQTSRRFAARAFIELMLVIVVSYLMVSFLVCSCMRILCCMRPPERDSRETAADPQMNKLEPTAFTI